ncbi:MAG: Subtilisin NAT precursor [Bacteroidetes bacterium ADurb.Bin408]|nr:MAG: Subtilisin NAT precursor [Bacteroidetes bacterium ADurb.Bin408]
MAGNVPGQLIGTSPKASFWLLRSEDGPTENIIEEYNWVSAAEFADSLGADIINSSLGYSEFDDPSQNHVFADLDGNTTVVSKGANAAASRGILVVNSAGNSAQTPWQRIIAPSDADSILTVGAVDENEVYAPFSSVGYTADGRVKPDVASQGANTVVASTQGGIMTGNGTSFSAPIVSGAVACLWQAHPNATNLQIIDAVKQSANHYNAPDSLTGYGIPNFAAAHMLLNGVNIPSEGYPLQVKIFPNPFTESFSVIFFSNDTQSLSLELYDINGRKVYSVPPIKTNPGFNNITLQNVDKISKGIYLLRIIYHEKTTYYKLVKIS